MMPMLFEKIATGELAGSATAVQMPNIACRMVKFRALADNAGNVYIGGEDETVEATLATSLAGANNDLTFTAVHGGIVGNRIRIAYIDPGAASQPLTVTVTETPGDVLIEFSLATSGASAITTTGDDIKTALLASADASAHVTAADSGGNDGSGVVTALAATALAGGGAGVTVAAGTTDATSGYQLDAGQETDWLPVPNLSVFFRICDNAGDDLSYIALVK